MGHSKANVRNLPAIHTRVRVVNRAADVGKGTKRKHKRQKERRQQIMLFDARGFRCESSVLRSLFIKIY
jgi:hypothetical protein